MCNLFTLLQAKHLFSSEIDWHSRERDGWESQEVMQLGAAEGWETTTRGDEQRVLIGSDPNPLSLHWTVIISNVCIARVGFDTLLSITQSQHR